MKKVEKVDPIDSNQDEPKLEKSVRGSGYTYDEADCPSDQSKPIDKDHSENIVRLPKLGKKDRP